MVSIGRVFGVRLARGRSLFALTFPSRIANLAISPILKSKPIGTPCARWHVPVSS